ncbi:hypothetical protein SOVF_162300 [Spinacia oleracea]|uniref:Uncharacterized protein At5g50100, chloroplastic n=1 Tax=Spinacia oleracea TaxID=3562 RepID=A0A9R0IFN9_SPIOL|nr:uncharacterized protein At5g50100, chloroplastic [Spinacia oleracea]KNA08466.1 hypothetical protein SOVF_162300 [Spinacia oleracea]
MALRSAISIGRRRANPVLFSATSVFTNSKSLPHSHRSFPFHVTKPGLQHSIRAIQGTTVNPITPKRDEEMKQDNNDQNWKIKMLYDGDCPLCMREVNMLREKDKENGAIKFVNISSEDYSPEENQGLDYKIVMGKIHAILSDGTVVTNVEAFRKLYEAVGLGWVYAITKYKPVAIVAEAVYGVWAKYRLQITGRPPIEQILESRRMKKDEVCNDSNSCKM